MEWPQFNPPIYNSLELVSQGNLAQTTYYGAITARGSSIMNIKLTAWAKTLYKNYNFVKQNTFYLLPN